MVKLIEIFINLKLKKTIPNSKFATYDLENYHNIFPLRILT